VLINTSLDPSCALNGTSDAACGYNDTPNDGGEYKVWVSSVATFDNDSTKTDNFKVREGGGGPGETANLCVDKFYDTNVNGHWDTGEQEITGWQFTVFGTVGFDTMQVPHTDTRWCSVVDPDTFHVTELDALSPPTWLHTTDPVVTITVAAGENGEVDFGNVCLGGGTGALTLGFWSNKNGQNLETAADFTALTLLCLRTAAGGDQDFNGTLAANKTALNTFLLGANATNMANMLSAQLAAMKLNVLHGKVSGSKIVGCPCGDMGLNNQFITIDHLMTAANAALCADGNTPAGDANRATQECLKTALDNANNNQNFVQSSPATCGTPSFPTN